MWIRLDGSYVDQYIWKKQKTKQPQMQMSVYISQKVREHESNPNVFPLEFHRKTFHRLIHWLKPPHPHHHPPPPLASPSTQVLVPNYVSRGIIAASMGLNGWFCVYEYLWICACVFVSLCTCTWGWENRLLCFLCWWIVYHSQPAVRQRGFHCDNSVDWSVSERRIMSNWSWVT